MRFLFALDTKVLRCGNTVSGRSIGFEERSTERHRERQREREREGGREGGGERERDGERGGGRGQKGSEGIYY